MSTQFIRSCELLVGKAGGEGINLSELRITFEVTSANVQTPNTAHVRVYNLAPSSEAKVQEEFTHLQLSVGYSEGLSTVFAGEIRQIRRGRESATDTFIDLIAADGDTAYNHAVLQTSLAAGWTPDQLRDACVQSMAPFGVTAGQLAPLPDFKAPRGATFYGRTSDFLTELAESYGMTWSIVLGQLHMLSIDDALGGDVVELTAESGLIGLPQQTIDGIMVRCLINPRIKPGSKIKLSNSSIQQAAISTQTKYLDKRPGIDPDGQYKVWAVAMSGDTRGQDWCMDLACTAIKGQAPFSSTYLNAGGTYGS